MPSTYIHLLNVGRGACTVLEHPSGRRTMIDINIAGGLPDDERLFLEAEHALREAARQEAGLTHPVRWYWDRFGTAPLFRFILSHPDTDHLLGIGHILNGDIPTRCLWDLPHTKVCEGFRTDSDWAHWEAYTRWRSEGEDPFSVTQYLGSDTYWFGMRPEWDSIEVLWPDRAAFAELNATAAWNNMSVVLRVWHAGRSVLLPGDIEAPTWRRLAALEDAGVLDLSSDVLVASHHGRASGYPPDGILGRIDPRAIIISTDKLPRTHNAAAAYARLAPTFATRWHGDIVVELDDAGIVDVVDGNGALLLRDLPRIGHRYGFGLGA